MARERTRFGRLCALSLLCVGLSSSVAAQPAVERARAHFVEGYELVERGELDAAIAEFEQAYAASPNFAVLFNLGQAYAAIGHSVEAVEKLELYLTLGGPAIPEERRKSVREAIEYQSRRIGAIELTINPAGTRVSVDGKAIGETPLSKPLRATPGPHTVVLERAGYEPRFAVVHVEPKRTSLLALSLEPAEPATLAVECLLPDVSLRLDGTETSLKLSKRRELPVAPGPHELSFSRPGYVPKRLVLAVTRTRPASVRCDLEIDPASRETAELAVEHPRGTRVSIDGRAHPRRPLPVGRHRVSVSGPGYDPVETLVSVAPGARRSIEVRPRPSSTALLEERRARQQSQRLASYIIGGVGAASATAALTVFLVNDAAYEDWRKDNAELVVRLGSEPTSVTAADLHAHLTRENSIRTWDNVAVGLGAFGAAALAGAAALFLWSYPDPPVTLTGDAARWRWRF
jgi:hypothetical protein